MKRFSILLLILVLNVVSWSQPFSIDAGQQGLKNGVHWVKRTWYSPVQKGKNWEPYLDSLPSIYLRPNQLIEYSKEGKMRSVTDFERGTDDKTNSTQRYFWEGGRRMTKEVLENAQYENIYSTTYSYDSEGNELKKQTTRGAGDRFGITSNNSTENTWKDKLLVKKTDRNEKGALQSEVTYNYDSKGRKIREEYYPAGLYSGKSFEYDSKGNLIKDSYLDKEGKPSTIWNYEYNTSGKPVKRIMISYYKGVKQSEEVKTITYNPQGDTVKEQIIKDGKLISDLSWLHKYDTKGNRVQTIHLRNGKPEIVEVLKLLYY